MNRNEFLALPLSYRQEYLFVRGEIISEIEEEHFYTSLFLLNNYYVEVFLCKRSNQVLTVFLQDDPETLLLYLDKLKFTIHSLLNK
jgi:hypothetical protein